jgi:hypothetical protein
MAEQDNGVTTGAEPYSNGEDTLPAVGLISQYVKDLSFENPNAPAIFQNQVAPQIDVQFNIGSGRGPGRVHRRSVVCRPVRAAQHPRRASPALPARRSAAPDLPVRAPRARRCRARRRLPAAAARADRFRRHVPGAGRCRRPAAGDHRGNRHRLITHVCAGRSCAPAEAGAQGHGRGAGGTGLLPSQEH